ncbi:MAG: hypothetical protein KDA81_06930 [Planctomycetaceae bacterium]|nr:hypothetical protein [Planctomycetaceae bacterium]
MDPAPVTDIPTESAGEGLSVFWTVVISLIVPVLWGIAVHWIFGLFRGPRKRRQQESGSPDFQI